MLSCVSYKNCDCLSAESFIINPKLDPEFDKNGKLKSISIREKDYKKLSKK